MKQNDKLKKLLDITMKEAAVLKNCPICGSAPELITYDYDGGNGHGYPGMYSYSYSCPGCELIEADSHFADIHSKDKRQSVEYAQQAAIKDWNQTVDTINKLIDKTRGINR